MVSALEVIAHSKRGIPVFPLKPGTKDGFVNGASDHGATANSFTIFEWFRPGGPYAGYNFGCWTAGGHVIIDIDADKGGLEAWSALVAEIGPVVDTFTVRSARGGLHLYFKVDERGELFSSADLVLGKINVRGINGYVVGPGSTFTDPATGVTGVYAIAVDAPVEPLPDNLRQRLRRRREDKQAGQIVSDLNTPDAIAAARARLSGARPAIQGQSGDQTTYELACAILDFGLSDDKAHELMLEIWNPRCAPPWGADELKVKVDNAWTYRQASIGRDNPSAGFYPMPAHLLRELKSPPVPKTQVTNGTNSALVMATPYIWAEPATIEPREWLYGKHLIRKFLSSTIAPGGAGKSTLAIADGVSLVTGRALLRDSVLQRGRFWYWNGEDPYDELQRRVQAVCLHYGVSREDIEGRLFVDTGRRTPIVIARDDRSGLAIADPIVRALKRTLLENRIDVFTVDPFIASHEVSENDNTKIDAVVRKWAEIADECNCAIDLVHHVRKTGGAELTAEDARGASALVNKARSVRVLNVMSKEDAAKAGVSEHRLHFRVDNGKQNLSAPAAGASWFKLGSVCLGNHRMDKPADSIGVVTAWEWPSAFDGLTADVLLKVHEALDGGRWRSSSQSKEKWVGVPVARALGLDVNKYEEKARVNFLISEWRRAGHLEEYTAKDASRKDRQFIRVGRRPH